MNRHRKIFAYPVSGLEPSVQDVAGSQDLPGMMAFGVHLSLILQGISMKDRIELHQADGRLGVLCMLSGDGSAALDQEAMFYPDVRALANDTMVVP